MSITKMMKVTNLIKNEKGLYEVSFDNEKLILDEDTVIKYRLFKNNEISSDLLQEIKYDDNVIKLSNKMLEYRLKYNKSINEIKRHYISKGIDIDIVDSGVELLINKNLLDDTLLASVTALSLARNSNGYYLIKEKLRQKLFDNDDIEKALDNLTLEDITYGKEKLIKKLQRKYLKEEESIRNIKIKKQLYNHGYRVDD